MVMDSLDSQVAIRFIGTSRITSQLVLECQEELDQVSKTHHLSWAFYSSVSGGCTIECTKNKLEAEPELQKSWTLISGADDWRGRWTTAGGGIGQEESQGF